MPTGSVPPHSLGTPLAKVVAAPSATSAQRCARLDTDAANLKILADIEAQCMSHKRHPAEWDNVNLVWIAEEAPAAPYFVVTDHLPKPNRFREVICELLGAGLPISRTAHLEINNAFDRKRVLKASKKLLIAGRQAGGLQLHVGAAVTLGILQLRQGGFYSAVQAHVASGIPVVQAVALVSKSMPETVGTIEMETLERWLADFTSSDYADQLKLERHKGKLSKQAGPAATAPASAGTTLNSLAEKTAQFIAGFYHQEMKLAKMRRQKGLPPRPLRADLVKDSGAQKEADVAEPEQGSLQSKLPAIPPGCTWGYCTPQGFFVPFDLVSHVKGDATKVVIETTNKTFPEESDVELLELAEVYKPVLWAPARPDCANRAWEMYLAKNPGVSRTDVAMKEAAAEFNYQAVRSLRVEHFEKLEVRQQVREVALMVQDRIKSELFVPGGSVLKALEMIKIKILVLELPERDPGLGSPLSQLLPSKCTAKDTEYTAAAAGGEAPPGTTATHAAAETDTAQGEIAAGVVLVEPPKKKQKLTSAT